MKMAQYMAVVAASYAAVLGLVVAYLGNASVFPSYKVVGITVLAAVFVSVFLTRRIMEYVRPDEPLYLLPTIIHTYMILSIIIARFGV